MLQPQHKDCAEMSLVHDSDSVAFPLETARPGLALPHQLLQIPNS